MNSDELSGTILGGDGRPETAEVRRLVAERVRTTPGVVRLEPSLQQALSRMAGAGIRAASAMWRRDRSGQSREDGVYVNQPRSGDEISVRVEVVVARDASIVTVGEDIRTGVRRLLTEAGFSRPRVDVAVLAVED